MQNIDLTGKTILVTGSAGFIGSNLVLELLKSESEATIIGLDNVNDYYDVSIKEWRLSEIGATRKTGGSNWGYKPPLLTRASRRGFSLCSSLSVIATLAAPKGAYLTNGSSYSFTLSLSTAISCFSWSLIYFLIVSSLRPTVLT